MNCHEGDHSARDPDVGRAGAHGLVVGRAPAELVGAAAAQAPKPAVVSSAPVDPSMRVCIVVLRYSPNRGPSYHTVGGTKPEVGLVFLGCEAGMVRMSLPEGYGELLGVERPRVATGTRGRKARW